MSEIEINGASAIVEVFGGVPGPRGEVGPRGLKGDKGDTGGRGEKGDKGTEDRRV